MGNDLVQVFLKVVNMSITAAYVTLFVCIARLALKKSPKVISYSLWSVVLFRLLCPVSFSSAISLLNLGNISPVSEGGSVAYVSNPVSASNPVTLPSPAIPASSGMPSAGGITGASAVETLILVAAAVWAAGVIIMLAISVISHIRLKRSISGATLMYGNVYKSGAVPSPFVYGIIRPRIYLPAGMDGSDIAYVLSHERMHITRRDNIIKPVAYLALCLHWFNPVMWAAFHLMCRDMEMSCDERVLRKLEEKDKAYYGEALLKLASSRSILMGSPLAFGESSVKTRIKNILRFRKPVIWIASIAVIAAAAIGVCLIANPGLTAQTSADELYGNYRFEKQVYMNDLSSFLAFEGYEEYYTLTSDTLTITNAEGEQSSIHIGYGFSEVNGQDFKALFMSDIEKGPDISQYKQRYQYVLCEPSGYTLYLMDGEVWLASFISGRDGVQYIWSIYSIEKYGGELPALTKSPETVSAVIADIEKSFLQDGLEIVLNIGGEEIHDLVIEDEAQKQIVEDAVTGFMLNPERREGVKGRPPGDFMSLDWDRQGQFLIYDKDGNHCIQNLDSGMYSILGDETHHSLLEIALGYHLSRAMTVISGENSVYAFENTLWTQVGDLHTDWIRLKPEQVADYIQYLNIVPEEISDPFMPYINGKKVYGEYKLYDRDFNEIELLKTSGPEPQTYYIFHDAVWPGTYIVELEAPYEINGIKMMNQYFFGVILPERPKGPLK